MYNKYYTFVKFAVTDRENVFLHNGEQKQPHTSKLII